MEGKLNLEKESFTTNLKQYHGYLALPRHAKMLLENLGHPLFSLYIALVMDARWHRDNKLFSCVVGTQTEIASRLDISQSKLSRGIDKIQVKNKKYVIKHKRYILLGYFPLFLTDVADKMHSKNYEDLHDLYSDMHRINAELQENYAVSQERRGKNPTQRFYSSSKDNLDSFDDISEQVSIGFFNRKSNS